MSGMALQSLVEALETSPAKPAGHASGAPSERHELLEQFHGPQAVYSQEELIHERFEARWSEHRMPCRVYEDESLTYGELNARANQLAHYLPTREWARISSWASAWSAAWRW